jgi:glycosyltransferase involved in cell wall biosynthesis
VEVQPKVSVLVITYNHADFIRQALESVLRQETTFTYEVLISEDCSTDGTRAIVTAYQQEHPARIRLLLSPHNVRNNRVVMRAIEAARGEYLALLDGDDYWTVPHKLQRQVDFLDRHPDCTVCFHNALVVDEDHSKAPRNWTPPDQKEISTLDDLWMGNSFATCSTLFRRGAFGTLPDWYIDLFPITDWPLHLLNAEHGLVGYIDEVMGVYRYHSRGFYSPLSEARKQETTLALYQTLNRNFAFKYDRLVKTGISKYFVEWAEEYLSRGDLERARACFRTALGGRPVNRYVSLQRLLLLWLRLYKPPALRLPRFSIR